jgi:thioredoxin 2
MQGSSRHRERAMTKDSTRVACQHCNGIVRVPTARLGDGPRCPSCHTGLFDGHPVELDDSSFDIHVLNSDLPVVVDFWAPWCAPCRMMAPAFEEAAGRMEPSARFAKLNTDAAQSVAARFAIRSIPTLVIFRSGREIARQSGAIDAARLERWLTSALAQ